MENKASEHERIMRLKEVQKLTSLSRATIYRGMDEGTFPRSVHLTQFCVGWRASDIDQWIASRVSTASDTWAIA